MRSKIGGLAILAILLILQLSCTKPENTSATTSILPSTTREYYVPNLVTREEASSILGEILPIPTYLPPGYEIRKIYLEFAGLEYSNFATVLINDTDIPEEPATSPSAFSGSRTIPDQDKYKIRLWMQYNRAGCVGSLKEEKVIEGVHFSDSGEYPWQGVLSEDDMVHQVAWQWHLFNSPNQLTATPHLPPCFRLYLTAVKDIPKDELIRIARSVSQK